MAKKSINQLRKEVKEFEERKKLEARLKQLEEKGIPKVSKGRKFAQGFIGMLDRAASRVDVSVP